jgi:hypothetical protein
MGGKENITFFNDKVSSGEEKYFIGNSWKKVQYLIKI